MGNFIDLSGQKYGRLLVIDIAGKTEAGSYKWNVICDCGKEKAISSDHLTRKYQPVRSCGCYRNDRIREICSPNPNKSAFNALIHSYKKQARIRGYEFELTDDEIYELTKGNCYYCDAEPSSVIYNKQKTGNYIYNGIDRIDNDLGYIKTNTVSCCKTCNYSKGKLSEEEFAQHITNIYIHWASKWKN